LGGSMGKLVSVFVGILICIGIAVVRTAAQGSGPWPGPEGGRVRTDTPGYNPPTSAGSKVADIVGRDLAGNPFSLKYSDSSTPTVVYYPCGFKPQEMDFSTVVAQKRDTFHFVVVFWDRATPEANAWVERYVADMKPSWDGVAVDVVKVSKSLVEALSLGGCPRTYVISTEGKVVQNWLGEWGGSTRNQVEQFFAVRLPQRDAWNGSSPK
jgi:hypothetical protein